MSADPALDAFDPLDVCCCGDYRRQHDALGCASCRDGKQAFGPLCRRFRLWRTR